MIRFKTAVFTGVAFWAAVIAGILILSVGREPDPGGDGKAPQALTQLGNMMDEFREKGYSDYRGMYPNGCGTPGTNSGKFCGLYYEMNNAGEMITLISVSMASADCRADGDTDSAVGGGHYIPCINVTGNSYLEPVIFNMHPRMGYWYALMISRGTAASYNGRYSENHFAIISFPDRYGRTGETMFIMNEEGTVYAKDNENRGYVDTFPADPASEGWEAVSSSPLTK